jgi:uncharacterized membrane protein
LKSGWINIISVRRKDVSNEDDVTLFLAGTIGSLLTLFYKKLGVTG